MFRQRKYPAALVSLIAVALVATLSASATDKTSNARNAASVPAAKPKIGFVLQVLDSYYSTVQQGAKQAAKAHPNVSVLFGAGTTGVDPASEIAKVQNMLAQGIKVLVIAPQGPGLIPVLNRAVSSGVKVIFVDTKIPTWHKNIAFIGTDNAKGSLLAGQYLAKRLGGKGEVAVMVGLLGCSTCELRYTNLKNTLVKAGITVHLTTTADECTQDKAVAVVKDLLVKYPNLNAIYAICGPTGIVVNKVLSDQGKSNILSVSWDALPQEVQDILNGKMDAAVAQFPVKLGRNGTEQAIRVTQGKTIPKVTDTGTAIVTKANAKQFLKPR